MSRFFIYSLITTTLLIFASCTNPFIQNNNPPKPTENTTQTGTQSQSSTWKIEKSKTEKQEVKKEEEKVVPTKYRNTQKRSYFYGTPDKQQKGRFIIRNDIIDIVPEKSTDTMFFASFYNAREWKITATWYVDKKDFVVDNWKKIVVKDTKSDNSCVRRYDFKPKSSSKYRRFEFKFLGKCGTQKFVQKFNGDFFRLFEFSNWMLVRGRVYFKPTKSHLHQENNSTGKYHDSFSNWEYKIKITGGNYVVPMGDFAMTEDALGAIDIEIENTNKQNYVVFGIHIVDIPIAQLQKEYNDWKWTLKNGFKEITNSKQSEFNWKSIVFNSDLPREEAEKWWKNETKETPYSYIDIEDEAFVLVDKNGNRKVFGNIQQNFKVTEWKEKVVKLTQGDFLKPFENRLRAYTSNFEISKLENNRVYWSTSGRWWDFCTYISKEGAIRENEVCYMVEYSTDIKTNESRIEKVIKKDW